MVLKAFAQGKAAKNETQARSVPSSALKLYDSGFWRFAFFRASRALVTLFDDVSGCLDDTKHPRTLDLAAYPLHRPMVKHTLYEGYQVWHTKHKARCENVEQATSQHNTSPAEKAQEVLEIKEEKYPRRPGAYHGRTSIDRHLPVLEGCPVIELSVQAETQPEPFPDFVDCLCLKCQGNDNIPETPGDHHNTECDCHECKAIASTSLVTSPSMEEPFAWGTECVDLNEHSGSDSDKNGSGYQSGNSEADLNASGWCQKLMIVTEALKLQQRDCLAQVDAISPLRYAVCTGKEAIPQKDGAYLGKNHTQQERSEIGKVCDKARKGTGAWCYEYQPLRELPRKPQEFRRLPAHLSKPPSDTAAHRESEWPLVTPDELTCHFAAIRAKVNTGVTEMELWATPRSEDRHDAAREAEAHACASAAENKGAIVEYVEWSSNISARKVETRTPQYDPFRSIPCVSDTVEENASRAKFEAWANEDENDPIDAKVNRRAARKAVSSSQSPTPESRVHPPLEWRKCYKASCQKRETQLQQLSVGTIKSLQVSTQCHYFDGHVLKDAKSQQGSSSTFATMVTGAVFDKLLDKEPQRPPAQNVDRLSKELGPWPAGECADVKKREPHASQRFFKGEKRSRFAGIFEELTNKERVHALASTESKGINA